MRVVTPEEVGSGSHWVATWAATPELAEEKDLPPPPFTQPDIAFHNTTIRQTLQVTTGGEHLRIRISNAFGRTRLRISSVTIALPLPEPGQYTGGSKAVVAETVRPVTFGGETFADIPDGALALSDPLVFPVQPEQVVTVSIYLSEGQTGGHYTAHEGSRTGSWVCHGDYSADPGFNGPGRQNVYHWYFIAGVEVWQPRRHRAFVLLGDSLTDGGGSTDNANDKWPDLLFKRMLLQPATRYISVVNQAAGGNSILQNSPGGHLLGRLDRDVFATPGVRYVMVFDGVNDIGGGTDDAESQAILAERLRLAFIQIAARVHSVGLPIIGATIGPMGGHVPYGTPARESTRQRLNDWIRTTDVFDAIVDFDAVLRDPDEPTRLRAEFDTGDHLHPNVNAFHAMANAFPLDFFQKFVNGVARFE